MAAESTTVPSPLRYAGSKSKCLAALDAHFQTLGLVPGEFEYHEPMMGSLVVGLHVMHTYRPAVSYLGDASPDIVNFFTVLKHHHAALVDTLQGMGTPLDEHGYYALRTRFNEKRDDPVTAAAAFYLLNRGCFNGVCRVNRKGEFNVPFGKFKKHGVQLTVKNWVALKKAHEVLRDTRVCFECVDVEDYLGRGPPSSPALLYLDPPYVDTDPGLYVSAFPLAKNERLRDLAGAWRAAGTRVAINNSPAARHLYDAAAWTVTGLVSYRSMGGSAETRGHGEHDILAY